MILYCFFNPYHKSQGSISNDCHLSWVPAGQDSRATCMRISCNHDFHSMDMLHSEEHMDAHMQTRPAQEKKKNDHIYSSQLRADQMPGPPWEGQLICTLSTRQ